MDMEAAMKRIPPHSAEAEQAVLGAGRSDHASGLSEGKRCSTGDQQYGICERSSHAGTDIRQCRYLCKDRPGKIRDAEAH